MNNLENTLAQACSILEDAGGQPSAETAAIRSFLISPGPIRAFEKQDLYLAMIRKLVRDRFNLSFPEDPTAYDRFVSDCVLLGRQMEKEDKPFNTEEWLNFVYLLFENIKTPYYSIYAETIRILRSCFRDPSMASRAISDVYSFLIKASADRLRQIHTIILHVPSYVKYPQINDALLGGILKDGLTLFGQDKNYWITSVTDLLYGLPTRSLKEIQTDRLLEAWLEKEDRFLEETFSSTATPTPSLSAYIARRTVWMVSHQEDGPDSARGIVFSVRHTSGQTLTAGEFLDTYAYNMNAASYIGDPAIGRENEISNLELILLSPRKSPIILGKAGVGKTAIAEGLAYRLARGLVPDLLGDRILYKLTTTSLLGGAKYVGEMEERIRTLTEELRSHPEIILFIDEIHTIVGAGSTESSNNDIANMLKPFIDRGDIKIIGATTRDEYERFILPDRALARRFEPLLVEEPDKALCLRILTESIPAIEYRTRVVNPYPKDRTKNLLQALIDLCSPENQPEDQITCLPELPLTLLEMAFSFAALRGSRELDVSDLARSVSQTSQLTKEARERWQ